jgi:hypothetical protein
MYLRAPAAHLPKPSKLRRGQSISKVFLVVWINFDSATERGTFGGETNMRKLILIAFTALSFSCERDTNSSDAGAHDSTSRIDSGGRDGTHVLKDTVPMKSTRPKPNLEFDLGRFVQFADSLVTVISGNETHFRYVISNRLDKTQMHRPFNTDGPVKKTQNYRLMPIKPGGEKWNISLLRVTYENSEKADWAMKQMKDFIKTDLTQKNNYLFNSGSEVVWLQTGCSYSEYNHGKVKEALLRHLKNNNPQLTINCECGKGCK